MELRLKGKTALVTGASAGIGRAIAKSLAAEGVKLCITARRRTLLEQLAMEVIAAGGHEPQIVTVDIMEKGAPRELAQQALKALGQIDILVNCAGGAYVMSLDAPEQKWKDLMKLNYTRVRQLTLAVVPDMINHQWGRIIYITGSSEPGGLEGGTAPKAAVHGFAKGLSREIAKNGITVNSISPGRANTEQTQRKYSERSNKEFAAREIPVGRLGEPEEIAYLVVCITSPLASYVTGNLIHVDGGRHRFAFT